MNGQLNLTKIIENKPLEIILLDSNSTTDYALEIRFGDTIVSCNMTIGATEDKTNNAVRAPINIYYAERYYSFGVIPLNYFKREDNKSDREIRLNVFFNDCMLAVFKKLIKNDVFISLIVISLEEGNSPELPASIGLSLLLGLLSNFETQPFAIIRMADIEGRYLKNPDFDALNFSRLDLLVAATQKEVINVNCSTAECSTAYLIGALGYTHIFLNDAISFQMDFIQKIKNNIEFNAQRAKLKVIKNDDTIIENFNKIYKSQLIEFIDKLNENSIHSIEINKFVKKIITEYSKNADLQPFQIIFLFYELLSEIICNMLEYQHKRLDNRQFNEFRKIVCEIGKLPSAHGSGIFKMGHTAVMSVATICPLNQSHWNLSMEGFSRQTLINNLFLHYFSAGGVNFGRLQRFEEYANIYLNKILLRIIPKLSVLPYVKRIIHEVLSTEGSTLSATLNAANLALKDAGIQIKSDFASVECGMFYSSKNDENILLADITGPEKLCADALINIVHTEKGLIGLNFKAQKRGVTLKELEKIIEHQRENCIHLIMKMRAVIEKPKPSFNANVQESAIAHLNINKLGLIAGENSKYIEEIKQKTACDIFIENDGVAIIIKRNNFSNVDEAKKMLFKRAAQIECGDDIKCAAEMKTEYFVGDIVDVNVVKLVPFGIFVETDFGARGPVYLSELGDGSLSKPEEIVKAGDKIKVVITEIDGYNYKFSHKKFLEQK